MNHTPSVKKNSKLPILGWKQLWKHRLKTSTYWKIIFCWFLGKDIGKPTFSSKSAIFIEISLLKIRMLLRQLCLNHSTRWRKIFRWLPQNRAKKWTFSPNVFHRGRREQIWQSGRKTLLNRQKVFCSMSGNEKKNSLFLGKLRSNCCFGHMKLNFTTLPLTLLSNCFKFFPQNPQMLKKQLISKKNSWKLLWTVREHFWFSWRDYLEKSGNFWHFFPKGFSRTFQ